MQYNNAAYYGQGSSSASASNPNNPPNNNNNNSNGVGGNNAAAGSAASGSKGVGGGARVGSPSFGIPVYPNHGQHRGTPQQQHGQHQQQHQQMGHQGEHPDHQLQQQLGGQDAEDDDSPKPAKTTGGRPRDKVWDLFDGHRDLAQCRYCSWKTDHPKAFRMRAHVQQCEGIPADKKLLLENWQAAKEDKKAAKMEENGVVKKVKRERDGTVKVPGKLSGSIIAVEKSPITCHVLDSTSGKPAPDMRIRLDRLNTSGFVLLASGITDIDGRCSSLLAGGTKLDVGIFKITFFTSEYFTKRGILSFYPFIEIPFEVKTADEHYHVPLLLAPYSYSTYRGS